MDKLHKAQSINRMVVWFVFLGLFLLLNSAPAFSKSPSTGLIRSGSVTIDGKTSDAISVSERHFTVSASTTILDMKKRKIRLSDLPVPCNATIEYRLIMDQDPVALKIKVIRLLADSSTSWPSTGLEGSSTGTRAQHKQHRGYFLKNR